MQPHYGGALGEEEGEGRANVALGLRKVSLAKMFFLQHANWTDVT